MSIDGFRAEDSRAFAAFAPEAAAPVFGGLSWISRRLSIDVVGLERIPAGRALLVANHAFGYDMALPMAAIWERLHRRVWALGEHAWWKVPFLRRLAAAVG